MIKNPHRQVRLRHGNMLLTANVPDVPGLKVGNRITLPESTHPSWRWEITWVSDHVNAKSALNRGWSNNI